jgi:class 3 adenylate cyclase/pimeloyl-ACP methyl ester carboxylesterase
MEPSIRFCTSRDGTQLAYATLGQGPSLLHVPGFSTNVETEWNDPECREWMRHVAGHVRLVRCQRRGVGASQRDVADVSQSAQVDDLTAVVDQLGVDKVAVLGAYDGAAAAVVFAAAHPERVSRLLLWAPFARGADANSAEAYNALADLARQNYRLFLRTWADLCFPSGPPARQRWYAETVRRSVSAEVLALYLAAMRDTDIGDIAATVRTPALVLHRQGDRYVPVAAGRRVARIMPDASFVPLEGDIGLPVLGDAAYLDRAFEFLGIPASSRSVTPGTVIILFTDIVDSTGLTERMGDTAFRADARELDSALRTIIRDAGGAVIDAKTLGDGILATFPAAARAIDAALRCRDAAAPTRLQLRLGLHAGDVIREEGNVFGGAVNVAARVCAASAPGEVLVTGTVRDLARTSARVRFEDHGEHELRGIQDPVRLYGVALAG